MQWPDYSVMIAGRWRIIVAVIVSIGCGEADADSAGADGIVLERTILPGTEDRFSRADVTCWLPGPGRPVRAVIVHQHGCGNSSATVNPPVARDFHWQALARKHDCALIVPLYTVTGECADWNDPDSGSERALLAALKDFATRAGRPDLETAPWILWGHSGGSSWAVQMILRHPNRVIAASLRGGSHKQFGDADFRARFVAAARDLPLLLVWGRGEASPESRHHVSWNPMQTLYGELREAGGRVALAIDPRTEHHCGDSRLLILSYYDAVLSARFGKEGSSGAWVNVASRTAVSPSPDHLKDPGHAWLPSESVARKWGEFSKSGTVTRTRAPSNAPVLHATLDNDARHVALRWQVEPELDGGLRAVRIYRDGKVWKEIGGKPGAFLATNRDSPPYGLHASTVRDDGVQPGATHHYAVSFTDGAGTESPLSKPVKILVPGAASTRVPLQRGTPPR
jgi:pimeloyl-ACP methyl ester carboxylesterase